MLKEAAKANRDAKNTLDEVNQYLTLMQSIKENLDNIDTVNGPETRELDALEALLDQVIHLLQFTSLYWLGFYNSFYIKDNVELLKPVKCNSLSIDSFPFSLENLISLLISYHFAVSQFLYNFSWF